MRFVWVINAFFLLCWIGGVDLRNPLGEQIEAVDNEAKQVLKNRQLEVSKLLSKLAFHDENAVADNGGVLGEHVNERSSFTTFNEPLERSFVEKPTYAAFKHLCSMYNSRIDQHENNAAMHSQMASSVDSFLEAVSTTKVFQAAVEYLTDSELLTESNVFAELRALWFNDFQSDKSANAASVFKTSFCTIRSSQAPKEIDSSKEAPTQWGGNWLSYYLSKQSNENPLSQVAQNAQLPRAQRLQVQSLSHEGDAERRQFLVGTSPELELAVFTV